jgi:hypothetical protein
MWVECSTRHNALSQMMCNNNVVFLALLGFTQYEMMEASNQNANLHDKRKWLNNESV